MKTTSRFLVKRTKAGRIVRTSKELAELRAVREKYQREKPTLEQILAATGQSETMTLGEYFRARELVHALQRERERQQMTLEELSKRTGCDPAVLSRLLTGRQVNMTLATIDRVASALGKQVLHSLQDASISRKQSQHSKRVRTIRKQKQVG